MSNKPPKPYPSWVWDDTLNVWLAPVSVPDNTWIYVWEEPIINWVNTGCKVYNPSEQLYTP
tara:strand:- start:760 stop:942 length:183 start_codon:yes stop_codon:yes gene_type:complete